MLAQKTNQAREGLTRNGERSVRALQHIVETGRRALDARTQLLSSLGHRSVLARGFVLVRDHTGQMVRDTKGISEGDALDLEFSDGHVGTTATSSAGKKISGKKRSGGGTGGGPQGSLF